MAHNRIIRLPEVKRRVGLSRSSIYEYIQKGMFPKQVPLGARAVGWFETDIDLWVDGHRVGGAL